MIWNHIRRLAKKRLLTARLQHEKFENLEFKHNWENLVKMYDLRMWYLAESPHHHTALQYTQELERLHNELNYLSVRTMAFRGVILTVLFYGFFAWHEMGPQDWQDMVEPKHELNLYNELDEGGDEGDDD